MSEYIFRMDPSYTHNVVISVAKKHYVYNLQYPEGFVSPQQEDLSDVIFYVGKGTRRRALEHLQFAKAGRLDKTCEVIRKVWKAGKQIKIGVLFESDDEQETLLQERNYIRRFSGLHLVNYKFNRVDKALIYRQCLLSETSYSQLLEVAHKRGLTKDAALAQIIEEAHREFK